MSEQIIKTEVWSNGGGTQSAAIAVLIIQGKLPKPDLAVIVDTGYEMPTTWDYLDRYVAPGLAAVGVDMIRIEAAQYACPWGRGLVSTSDKIMMPVYTTKSGSVSKLSGFCSGAWKVEAMQRYLTIEHGLKPRNVKRWIGFSLDEARRWRRMEQGADFKRGCVRFPLVYDVPMRRQTSIELVRQHGWPEPPRSRCWMCPHQSDHEWREVQRDYPELWERACAIDDEIRITDAHTYLHSTVAPLRDADVSAEDDLFSGSCASGVCML